LRPRCPRRLGISTRDSGGWEDLVRLDPNRNLPVYAVDGVSETVEATRLETFCVAHHWSAVLGILSDRLADHQVVNSADMMALRRFFLAQWIDSLAEASGSSSLARRHIACARAAWRRGLSMERRGLGRGEMDGPRYAFMVGQKLDWIATTTRCLLTLVAGERRARQFDACYRLFLLSLQCIDDALDTAEDRTVQGADFPTVLGCSANGLLSVARHLEARTQQLAREHSFHRLADWLEVYGVYLGLRLPRPVDPLDDAGNIRLGQILADNVLKPTLDQWVIA
jgi:hypothetical protein